MKAYFIVGAAAVLAAVGALTLERDDAADAASERPPTAVRTVTVRNECSDPVWLYYGPSPPVRPQDALPLIGNGSTAQPMLEGDTIWLLSQDRVALDDATVGASTDTVVIGSSCATIDPADRR